MNDEFGVDTEGLLRSAPQLAGLASQVGNVYSVLYGRLSELGEPWGGDTTGKTFEELYRLPAQNMMTAVDRMSGALLNTRKGIVTMAKGFEATEFDNSDSIRLGDPVRPDPTVPHPHE
jgi:hypothetical protein